MLPQEPAGPEQALLGRLSNFQMEEYGRTLQGAVASWKQLEATKEYIKSFPQRWEEQASRVFPHAAMEAARGVAEGTARAELAPQAKR